VLHVPPISSSVIIFGKGYKWWSFSLWNILLPPLTSSLSSQHIFCRTLLSNNFSLCSENWRLHKDVL